MLNSFFGSGKTDEQDTEEEASSKTVKSSEISSKEVTSDDVFSDDIDDGEDHIDDVEDGGVENSIEELHLESDDIDPDEVESIGEFSDEVDPSELDLYGDLEDFESDDEGASDDDDAPDDEDFESDGSGDVHIPTNENSEAREQADDAEHPEDIVEPENALPPITLEELPDLLKQAAANAGWTSLMPVQAKALPYMLASRDLMVQSRTGSGKTGAFLLPILERIDTSINAAQALILVPTRELAQQVAKEAALLTPSTGMRSIAVYGGVSYGPQIDAFEKGAHLVIGTPGRILDHLLRRTLRLDDLQIMVFDEADRMLSMGFYPDMREVQRYLPRHPINAYMFSATFPANVLRLAREFLVEPDFLSLSKDRVHVSNAEHIYYMVPSIKKDRSLIRLIEIENPSSAIIFCNTKVSVNYVTVVLQRFGYDADQISSDLNQATREKVLARIKAGKLRILVATDVAARGIDVHELSHVFQYEPPEDPESYIHRAGRTARAGASGKAISLIENIAERLLLERIAKRYSIEMDEQELPTDEDVTGTVAERVTTLLEAKLRDRDNLQTERMQRFIPTVNEWAATEQGATLLAMLLDDFYQESLHMPLVPDDEPKETRSERQNKSRSSSGSKSSRGSRSRRDDRRDDRRGDRGGQDDRKGRGRRSDGRSKSRRGRDDNAPRKTKRDEPRNSKPAHRNESDSISSSSSGSGGRRANRKSDAAKKAAEERSRQRRERLKKKS